MKDTLPITGGKGSFGNAVLHEFLDSSNVKEIKNLEVPPFLRTTLGRFLIDY